MRLISPEDWRPRGVEFLEPAAWEALKHEASASVVAGPGAGKTEFLAQRACYLLETGLCSPPQRILAISFKRDAAANLGERVQARAGDAGRRFISMTFDGFTKGILDRFQPALPASWRRAEQYRIDYAKPAEVDRFLGRLGTSTGIWQDDLQALSREDFVSRLVGTVRLDPGRGAPTSAIEFAVRSWWHSRYLTPTPPLVDFVMLNRLAELLVRSNPPIQRALSLTYPYVFIDESQDTTFAQYDFLTSVFGGAATITAVGDGKQRIMGWAGARDDAFADLESSFNATRFELHMNFRSSAALVAIQHVFARALDNSSMAPTVQVPGAITSNAAQIWSFKTADDEARHISDWIAGEIASSGKSSRDFALLARQKPELFEHRLAKALARHGLSLRNESLAVSRSTLQEVLVDELTILLLGIIRLAAGPRAATVWNTVCTTLLRLHGVEPEDHAAGRRLVEGLSAYLRHVRRRMREVRPDASAASKLVDSLMNFVGREGVRGAFVAYRHGDGLEIAEEAFRTRIANASATSDSWLTVCDEFEQVDAVALLTVHKSKGLEYDSVVFLGIDDSQWWSYSPGQLEGKATFFVGLSRAAERVLFTFCEERGKRAKVQELYDLLAIAGVPERVFK